MTVVLAEFGAESPAPSQAHHNLVAGEGNKHGKEVGPRWGDSQETQVWSSWLD